MAEPETKVDPLEGLTRVTDKALERVAIRMRESGVTLSAWRLGFSAVEGQGAIFLVETPGGGTLFRGDGICLGWPQPRLEAAYQRLLPGGSEPEPDTAQLG